MPFTVHGLPGDVPSAVTSTSSTWPSRVGVPVTAILPLLPFPSQLIVRMPLSIVKPPSSWIVYVALIGFRRAPGSRTTCVGMFAPPPALTTSEAPPLTVVGPVYVEATERQTSEPAVTVTPPSGIVPSDGSWSRFPDR